MLLLLLPINFEFSYDCRLESQARFLRNILFEQKWKLEINRAIFHPSGKDERIVFYSIVFFWTGRLRTKVMAPPRAGFCLLICEGKV